jgi:hypothetical protein
MAFLLICFSVLLIWSAIDGNAREIVISGTWILLASAHLRSTPRCGRRRWRSLWKHRDRQSLKAVKNRHGKHGDASADELNVNVYICIGPDAISRKHRDIEPGCENQANAIRKGESLAHGERPQSRDLHAIGLGHALDRQRHADEATLPVVGLKRRWISAFGGDLRQNLRPIDNADR